MNRKLKILFVCGGNTCRSPMAASVAGVLLGGQADVSSAGVEAWGQRASPKAIALMQRRYRVDLSSHRSTDLEHVHLDDFDFIVSMEARFAKRLAEQFNVPIDKIVIWNIRDPAVEDTEAAYESCLSDIERLLPRVLKAMLPSNKVKESDVC
jgi:protein-tyrosine-phosphatase